MKILYCGSTKSNSGPDNVNKGMVANLTKSFTYIKSENKLLKYAEGYWKCLWCDVAVFSGGSKQNSQLIKFAKKLKKKTAFVMHGCAEYEVPLNGQIVPEEMLQQERTLLEKADLLLPVSPKFSKWIQNRYPQYAHKTQYLTNGVDVQILRDVVPMDKIPGLVVAAGADRVIKNNKTLAETVDRMGGKAKLDICGHIYGDVSGEQYTYARYTGRLDHDVFMKRLSEAEVYVLNSINESFCLTVIEALACGCSVLVSNGAGVVDVLELEETDIIFDPMDREEIQRKLEYVLENPNHQRIFSKLDLDEMSYQKSVERLEKICEALLAAK